MAINDSTTSFGSYKYEDIASKLSSTNSAVSTAIGDLLGEGDSLFSLAENLYEGGFAGMSSSGKDDLKNHIISYVNELQDIIDGYDANADLTAGLAEGSQAQQAASDFIVDIKLLIDAYISQLKTYASDLDTIYENYQHADESIGTDVGTAAESIKNAASDIKVD